MWSDSKGRSPVRDPNPGHLPCKLTNNQTQTTDPELPECLRLLGDSTYYAQIDHDPTARLQIEIRGMIEEACGNSWISQKEAEFLDTVNPCTPYFYCLVKIHKGRTPPPEHGRREQGINRPVRHQDNQDRGIQGGGCRNGSRMWTAGHAGCEQGINRLDVITARTEVCTDVGTETGAGCGQQAMDLQKRVERMRQDAKQQVSGN
ncbi:hypothetical protein NDU88_002138 [Pleurodeles waltl]|uniref:Uncharacterized protein n=1 Tax=Pleurodeles waltl TaxID=8319 RepID=A0AAV7NHQ8_PLEWA|nr:hypothetical protein NDU88_002138 [Pleurodeles waltl]